MASVFEIIGLVVVIGIHTVMAALLTRVLRVRLVTRWAPIVYVLILGPLLLTVSTLITTGVFKIGPHLGSVNTAFFLTVVTPLSLGVAFDYLWMPKPEDVQLPEPAE